MKDELLRNVQSFWKSAELVHATDDYTSATILYFKCFFAIMDYVLYFTIRKTPKDHSERFRLLEVHLPAHYKLLDKYHPIYRDTYSSAIDKETCEEVRQHVLKIIKEQNIQI